MKFSVCAQITYSYEVEVPDDINKEDIQYYCDNEDPAYRDLCKVLSKYHLNFDGEILSVINDDTDEVIYMN